MDRAIDAAFSFAARLLRTAFVLLVWPRRAAVLIRYQPSDPRRSELVSDWSFLLVTSLLAGSTLRATSGLMNGLVTDGHLRVLSMQLREISIGSAMLGALPLIAVSAVIARMLASASVRTLDDRTYMARLVRYALGESYLVSFLFWLVPGAAEAVLDALPPFFGIRPEPRAVMAIAFMLFAVIAFFCLLYVIIPVIVPAVCIASGVRCVAQRDRRRYVRVIPVAGASIVLLALAPAIARRVYTAAAGWLPEPEHSVSVAIQPGPPEVLDADRSCSYCPAVSIPVTLVNRGKVPVTFSIATIQLGGDRVKQAVTALFPVADCDWFVVPAEFTPDSRSGTSVLRPGELVTGRIRGHVSRGVLEAAACALPPVEPVQLRAGVMAAEVSDADEPGEMREARSAWANFEGLCPVAKSIPAQTGANLTDVEQVALPMTVTLGFLLESQCSIRWSSFVTSRDEKREREAMELLFGHVQAREGR